MDYLNYNAEEIAALESFQDYYLYQKEEARIFWERWLAKHPHKTEEVEAAKKLLDILHVTASTQEIKQEFSKLETAIDRSSGERLPGKINRRKIFRMIGAAAAAAVLLFLAQFFWWSQPDPVWVYSETGFGEMRELHLPDGSVAYLNSNSSLKYDSNWTNTTKREVWLEGEGFFEVNKKPKRGAPQFIVHSNDIEVKVLGTVFNVYNRNQQVAVVLESGSVAVSYQQNGTAQTQQMVPNDIFEINANEKVNFRQSINTKLYTSWKDNKLVLEDTPLRKVVDILEDNFGFEVIVEKQEILQRKLTATIPIIDINILLEALHEIYGLEIKKEDRRILIQ